MRFDINRLSTLAGIERGSKQPLNEASNRSMKEDPSLKGEDEHRFGKNQISEKKVKKDDEDDEENLDEVLEIDEKDLVEELRRLRRLSESKKRSNRKQNLQEAQLKTIIEHEVKSILQDIKSGKINLNMTSEWVYGNKKPRNSRNGYVTRSFKGPGFK
jgi:hypothetical protein